MIKKKIGFIALALLTGVSAVYAAGAFQVFPLVGDTSGTTCLSFGSTPSTSPGNCTIFRPAGPAAMTGNEQMPADTTLNNPATVLIPITSVFGGAQVFESPLTGVSITLTAGQTKLIITPAGTIAAHTVVLPAASVLTDGYVIAISSTQIITALTLTPGTGTTIVPSITTLATANKGTALIYRGSTAQWNLLY